MDNARGKHESFSVAAWFWITAGLLVATLLFFEFTNLDLQLQRLLYDPHTRTWLVDGNAPLPRLFFYSGVKWVLAIGGAVLFFLLLAGFRVARLRPWRRVFFFMILCMGMVPLLVAGAKNVTNVFCPSDLALFNGNKPYVRLFEPMPAGIDGCGCCFPAGHASGGFALMALYFLSARRRRRALGLAAGIGLGWIMGIYQMAKGAHFLSHTIVTMELAWMLILLFYALLYRGWRTPLARAVCTPADGVTEGR